MPDQPPETPASSNRKPQVFVVGGPNGAGKSTIANKFVGKYLALAEFVNADVIARGLAGFDPDSAAIEAGRIMLTRVRELAAARRDFSFETTLASRSFSPWLAKLVQSGYEFNLAYSWLRSPELAISRVKRRVREGGHFVPDETVTRRYGRSVWNLFNLYMPIATQWQVYDNSQRQPQLVAHGGTGMEPAIRGHATWLKMQEIARAAGNQSND